MLIDCGYEGSLSEARDFARKMEQSGLFHGLWLNDTSNDPFLLSQAAISATSRILVGTNIAVAFARSPFALAQTAYNLAHLSEGRFCLGLGTQVKAHIEKRFSASWPDKPIRALKEYVALLRHLFDCFEKRARPSFRGDYSRCTLGSPVFTPDHHQYLAPKIGFSAVGPVATRAAGQVADCVFLHPFTHLKYLHEVTLPALEQGKQKRAPERGKLEVVGSCFILASDSANYAEARSLALGRLAFYASTPNYKAVLTTLGLEELHRELHALSKRGEWQTMASILPPEFVSACLLEEEAARLPDALQERFGALYDRVVVDGRLLL